MPARSDVTRGEIALDGVSHHYGRGAGGLDDVITLIIAPGEKVGLVGRSGAGKSTLVNLMLRFFDTEERGDPHRRSGHPRGDAGQSCARRSAWSRRTRPCCTARCGTNILYGRPDASEAAMVEAARRAEAHDFILDSRPIMNGAAATTPRSANGASSCPAASVRGSRIARVILKDAPILVLDEATSRARQRDRGGDPGHALRRHAGQDRHRDRAPPLDHSAHGSHHRARRRPRSPNRARMPSFSPPTGYMRGSGTGNPAVSSIWRRRNESVGEIRVPRQDVPEHENARSGKINVC
jgi:GTPase SAR1 family protein